MIVDDDSTPGVAVEASAAKAGSPLSFTLRLTASSNQTITVRYQTVDGTAVAGVDYTAASNTVTFTAGQVTRTVDVATIPDAPERDETVTLHLYDPINVLMQAADADGTIRNRRKGDLNGDGYPDLLWQHTDGRLEAWFMNGATQIGTSAVVPSTTSGWTVVGLGDFNSDGMQDLVWAHTDGSISVWLMADTTRLSGQATTPGAVADVNWRIRGVDDLNRDGQPDLYWQHLTTGQLAAWTMNGLTQIAGFSLNPNQVADTNWRIMGTGFFNADPEVDLVWMHQTSGALSAWLMTGATQSSGPGLTPSSISPVWRLAAVSDLNADGSADLLWQHTTTGEVSVWFMNGVTQTSGQALSPTAMAESGWTLVSPK